MPSDFASVLRRFADSASVCWQRTGAHPARHPSGFSLRTLAAPQGAPFGRHPAAEARARAKVRARSPSTRTTAATECRDARIRGSTRRLRCRASQAGREKPEGSRRWIAAIAQQYRMYCLRDAASPRSAGQFDSHDANRTTAVGA